MGTTLSSYRFWKIIGKENTWDVFLKLGWHRKGTNQSEGDEIATGYDSCESTKNYFILWEIYAGGMFGFVVDGNCCIAAQMYNIF